MLQSQEMMTQEHPHIEPFLHRLIEEQLFKRCLVQVPLQFQFQPVQVLTKQITKFNSNSDYRVLYLGPRWSNNHKVHKQLSHNLSSPCVHHPQQFGLQRLEKYKVDINPKQRTYIMKVGNHFSMDKNTFYYRAFQGVNPTLKEEEDIRFDSHFESGNLDCVIKVDSSQYDLFIRIDSNTRGHVLWYYFSVSCKEKQRIKLNICNIMKHSNLYKKNMKPYIFSNCKFKQKGTGWEQGGDNVVLEEKQMRYNFVYQKVGVRKLSQLGFEYQFQYKNDEVFFAYCVPYTYSLLLHSIEELKQKTEKLNILEIGSLGTSLLGVKIPLLKITDCSIPMNEKKIVLITGRIHPGESCGSLMVEGLLQHLCSSQGLQLRRQAVFIVIPMMNPDGVILGNYRTGVSGVDLNRVFQKLNRQIYPEVFHLKTLVKRLCFIQPIYLYLDFHGHSSKKNAFSYGPAYKISDGEYYKAKLLPKLTSLKTPMFRYYSCMFRIAEAKKDTARSVFFYEYNIPYTFTIQASNGSFYDQESKLTIDFTKEKWIQVGNSFVSSIQQFIDLLQIGERKELVQTAGGGGSRRRFGSPSKSISNDIGIFQQSLQLTSKKQVKNQYQFLIDQIKNDQRKHKKEQSDCEVSSDDDNIEDGLPKAKLLKLSKSIVQNCHVIETNRQLTNIRHSQIISNKQKKVEAIDNVYTRKYQLLNKSRKIRPQKNEVDRKEMVNRMYQTNIIIRKKSQNEIQQLGLMSQRCTQQTEEKEKRHYSNWKGNSHTPYNKRGHNKRNISAGLTYRNNVVPKVQMSLDIDEQSNINLHRDQQELKKLLEITQGKTRSRTRSLSQTQKRKRRVQEQLQSFLYPQVFHFDEFIEQNNKILFKLNKRQESNKVRYSNKTGNHMDHSKVSCPSAFYKIKQNLNNRKRDDSLTTLEKGAMMINNIKK